MSQTTFHVLTLFPEMIQQSCNHSILKRATTAGHIKINCVNIRDFAEGNQKQVDDYPYGGGAGMVMMSPPIYNAYKSINCPNAHFVYMSPQGKTFDQSKARQLSGKKDIIMLCGHYEGVDQRVIDALKPEEISIGDYVLTGGELAALVVIDAVARLIPGVVGKGESVSNESFSAPLEGLEGLLEYPQYTRPPQFMGMEVPDILLSGNHGKIEEWRRMKSLEITREKRPDLIENIV